MRSEIAFDPQTPIFEELGREDKDEVHMLDIFFVFFLIKKN
jgi:hypothetical protein